MDPEALIKAITENPITAGLTGAALTTVVGFCRPVLRALQSYLIRRLDQAARRRRTKAPPPL